MSELFLPTEVLQKIVFYTDLHTNIHFLSTCKEFGKLSQNVDYWSSKAENEQLCEKVIFEEFHRNCSGIKNKECGNIRKQIEYIMQTLKDKIIFDSNNVKFVIMILELNRTFMRMNDTQIIKLLLLLTTSIISLYNYFYKGKNWDKQCISFNFRTEKQCTRKSLPFCDYCSICINDILPFLGGGIDMTLMFARGSHKFIVIKKTLRTRTVRDIVTNYVFVDSDPNMELIGKMNNRCIESVTKEDVEKAKTIYKREGLTGYLI
jgi:hypothetical protein